MAITYQEVSRTPTKRGGVDITCQLIDSVTGEVRTKACYFCSPKPKEQTIKERFDHAAASFQYDLDNPPKPPLERDEVERMLVEKGYLTEGQTWEDLPDKEVKI